MTNLVSIVSRKLKAALKAEVDDTLVTSLLTSGRILVVFDRLSERDEQTFENVERLQGVVPAGVANRAILSHFP